MLDASGAVVGSTGEDEGAAETLARAAQELVAAAAGLRGSGDDVTRVEVELEEGAVFVLREGEHTIAATTGPQTDLRYVAYDLRHA